MEKYLTKSQARSRAAKYAVKIGLPLVLIGIGISLFFTPNFWTGVIIFCIGIWLATRDIARQPFVRRLKRRDKIFLRIAYVAAVLAFAWWLFRPVQVELQASSNVPTYGEGTDVSGIHWTKEYSDLRLSVRNNSDLDYDNLDIAVTTDETFVDLRQTSGLASCTIAPEGEPFFVTSQRMVGGMPIGPGKMAGGVPIGPADTSGQNYTVIAVDKTGRIISISGGVNQTYRIRCEKFPAHNVNTFVAALGIINPIIHGQFPNGLLYALPKPATRFSARINFTTSGRPRTVAISDCKMGQACKS